MLVELVQDDRLLTALPQFDDDAATLPIALVAHRADAAYPVRADELPHLLQDTLAIDEIGNFSEYDALLSRFRLFGVRLGSDDEPGSAGAIGLADGRPPADEAAGREVRPFDDFHKFVYGDLGLVDHLDECVADLGHVMGRYARRHSDGNSGRAVAEQTGKFGREDRWLLASLIVIRHESDGVQFEVPQQVCGRFGEAGLGISHSCRRVAVDRTEIPLPVDKWIAVVEILGHPGERRVDRLVTMRVVVAAGVADDFGAFAEFGARSKIEVVHRDQDAPLRRLQTVLHAGQRPADDDAHGERQV